MGKMEYMLFDRTTLTLYTLVRQEIDKQAMLAMLIINNYYSQRRTDRAWYLVLNK